jgi:3-mercaptopyruvate sulfurtransferase SseA
LKARPLVRASDIGLWGFCQRAWWLARARGVEHQRPALLAKGIAAHQAHGQTVQRARQQMTMGRVLLALGMIAAGVILLLWGIQGLF